jgi:hypothetical protein
LKESEKVKMESLEKQDTTTGSGTTQTPILASEKDPTAVQSKPPQEAASIAPMNTSKPTSGTKPQTLAETVSLLQTDCFDLRSFGCKLVILARDGKIYIAIEHPDHSFGFDTVKGNITLDSIASAISSASIDTGKDGEK